MTYGTSSFALFELPDEKLYTLLTSADVRHHYPPIDSLAAGGGPPISVSCAPTKEKLVLVRWMVGGEG